MRSSPFSSRAAAVRAAPRDHVEAGLRRGAQAGLREAAAAVFGWNKISLMNERSGKDRIACKNQDSFSYIKKLSEKKHENWSLFLR